MKIEEQKRAAEHVKESISIWLKPVTDDLPDQYLVGGTVRDLLIERVSHDLDLACRDPETAARILAEPAGAKVVLFDKRPDAPGYRVIDRNDHENTLDICGLVGDTIEADLANRDFTINAMAMKLDRTKILGELLDPLNGQADLQQKTIRLAGPHALDADPLRMLRAFRLAAELDFAIASETENAIRHTLPKLSGIASERIRAELIKTMATPHSAEYIKQMSSLGLLQIILPETLPMQGCTQNSYHHLNVWDHCLAVHANCEFIINHLDDMFGPNANRVRQNLETPPDRIALLKLSALLHDAGKPVTRGLNEKTGRITFYGHNKAGSQIIQEICQRLKFSTQDREFLQHLVKEHLHIQALANPAVRPATRMRLFRRLGEDLIPLLILGMADIKGKLGPDSLESGRNAFIQWAVETVNEYYNRVKEKIEEKGLINGNDLIALGVSPGPEIGALLDMLRKQQDNGLINTREQAMAFVTACIDKNGMGDENT